MTSLKRAGRIIINSLNLILGLVMAYLLVACVTTIIPVNRRFTNSPADVKIWVSSNGVHVNIIVPVHYQSYNWNEFFEINQKCSFLAFGWGDKEFYMNTPEWQDLKLKTALSALFLPTKSVVQVYCLSSEPILSKTTKLIHLSDKQYNQLIDYLNNSFKIDFNHKPIEIIPEAGKSARYHYYEANGKYSLFFTCNNWAGRGLKKAGVKNALWAPFDKSVLFYLK